MLQISRWDDTASNSSSRRSSRRSEVCKAWVNSTMIVLGEVNGMRHIEMRAPFLVRIQIINPVH